MTESLNPVHRAMPRPVHSASAAQTPRSSGPVDPKDVASLSARVASPEQEKAEQRPSAPALVPPPEATTEVLPRGASHLSPTHPASVASASQDRSNVPLMDFQEAPVLNLEELRPTAVRSGPADLGPGFPPVASPKPTWARRLHDLAAYRLGGVYNAAAGLVLSLVGSATERGVGLNAQELIELEESMYRMLVPSRDGYVGGSPPIFQALAQGQAAYIHLEGDPEGAAHLTRLYSSLPAEQLVELGVGADRYTPVRQVLLDRIKRGDFPVFIDTDGDFTKSNGTETVAAESIASIARRENTLGAQSADPSSYYRWLVTRVDSHFRRTDPWLFASKPALHGDIEAIRSLLTPNWVREANNDPAGSLPSSSNVNRAYARLMATAGGGQPPTIGLLTDFADTAVSLDRDLMFAVQTHWAKLMRELLPQQRASVFAPLAAAWVELNVLAPSSAAFDEVSPSTAPYIELIDQHSGRFRIDRYDRAMALSEVVDHTLDGLGIEERKQLLGTLRDRIANRANDITQREQRIRRQLGASYDGLDVAALLEGRVDGSDPAVAAGLSQLRAALASGGSLPSMTPERADLLRHMDMLDFVATAGIKYQSPSASLAHQLGLGHQPLLVGDYWSGYRSRGSITPVRTAPLQPLVLGTPVPGRSPLPVSVVLEGGGGKGFAYVECLRQLKAAMATQPGQVAIDQYVGTSAGAIMAGLLACGFSEDEIASLTSELDFKKFYADYLWMAGGVDPQVRGFDRTGLFTTRQMYNTLQALFASKLGVEGRPVLFRDLPQGLRVVATVINDNLPQDLRDQLGIEKDGRIVFSRENTPDMDVAAAICASAAVPTFFAAPQVQVARQEEVDGREHLAEYRLQLVDGGVVDGSPNTLGLDSATQPAALVLAPAYYEAPGASPGEPRVRLSTLNFDPANLVRLNAYNAQRYAAFAPGIARTLTGLQQAGAERGVLSLNLTVPENQGAPLVQGRSPADTARYRELAQAAGLGLLEPEEAAKVVEGSLPHAQPRVGQLLLDGLFDGQENVFDTSLLRDAAFNPTSREATHLADVLIAIEAANTVAADSKGERRFER